ncbi:Anthranilate phosphoribosyltransferase [Desulfurobacterium thermolithotrophum DSM 11699]|uniref:Anthranilate phosphoribosyltransferase n=1 Tax=Desulfurobacterium thermolithotrophum (strain DSM 11699 / BSA) TaxID=868864 RepID=F0S1T3_DESTD|nr:anthranilate phosphoribosyltransferase [Desulfurobacterium thermolithotrophum]ADY72938.1 Anthranilate phosphoribosyltransferase [Desulfurobacterium thermolithotrophum DSM 11699]
MEVKEVLNKLVEKQNLSFEATRNLFTQIMDGKLTDVQIAGILVALRSKGETTEEIAGATSVMREKSLKVPLSKDIRERIVDTCGTGGDLKGTFNISTTVALVVAACGVPVAKHGNRSVSSKCGSADILEAFGVKIDLTPEQVAKCIGETNFGFMFAPRFHPAMATVVRPRKELGIRTVFNLLGPMTNPAGAKRQLMGVFADYLTEKLAEVLLKLGTKKAFIVHGKDGTDEITICDMTKITEISDGDIKSYIVSPEDFGIRKASFEELKGGETLEENREIVKKILTGEEKGAKRDVVLLNAAFALLAAEKVSSVEEGIELANSVIEEGKPYKLLLKVVKVTNTFS